MKIIKICISIICLLVVTASFCQEAPAQISKMDNQGFREVLVQYDNLYIAGQPDKEGLLRLKALGVDTVVNLRTDREMNDREIVPYDEAAFIDSLGMKYVHIPLGGQSNPYTPIAVEQFNMVMNDSKGKVLLHCTVAWRASHLWAAYLIKYQGIDSNKALEMGKEVNLGTLPIESFLNKKMTFSDH